MTSKAPEAVLEHFKAGMPSSFQLLSTVVFQYNGLQFSAIGTLEIDAKNRTFSLACVNPMGVKLFELSGDDKGTTTRYALPNFTQYGDVGSAIGNDIRRIYFDLLPSQGASTWKTRYQLHLKEFSGTGTLEYVFAGQDDLMAKRYYENNTISWDVSYYEYKEQGGKRYPLGIVLINYEYGYRLTVRQKELR